MPSSSRTVLVSGASVAGPTLAHWLHRFGYQPTVVERTPEIRTGGGGHAVDLFGPALEVMRWMGLDREVEAARTATQRIALVRSRGRVVEVPAELVSEGVSDRHVEIMRGDLARILSEASRNQVEYILDNSIQTLHDDGSGVDVTFERGAPRRFDLVIGADGLHSITRRLVFGPEAPFLRFLGGYLAVFTVPNHLYLEVLMIGFVAPGRTAALYPIGDGSQARAVFLWRSPSPLPYDRHDGASQRRLIRSLYGDLGWEVPRILAGLDQADDLYLDSISQVELGEWCRGRVALVGDAGYSPGAAVGGGTSVAVLGAYALASQLARAGGNHVRGFAAYQRCLEPVVRQSRRIGPTSIKLLIPRSRAQIFLTAQALRALPHVPPAVRRWLTAFGGAPAGMLDAASLVRPEAVPRLPR